ncbi:MAG: glycosyltransferase [Dolichospermum sp. BR01]|nr:glycosyltransferase [Dolichospermum sp. BR01]
MNDLHPNRADILPIQDENPRPLWSVMIPSYNSADDLRQTLTSVLDQDLGSDIMEIEVVDDCSTKDDPKSIVEELGRGRVGFYQQPQNLGLVGNFTTCVQRARGHLIHILHSDDYVRDGFYRKMQKLFAENPEIGAAFCRQIKMNPQGHWQTISPLEQPESGVLSNWLQQIAAGQRILTPSIVVRRSVYENLGCFDRRMVCCGEDWEMWVRIAAHYAVAYEPEPLSVYRFKPIESLDSGRVYKIIQDMQMATDIIQSYLPEYLDRSTTARLLNQAREKYAQWPIDKMIEMFSQGEIITGLGLFQSSLKCHLSWKTIGIAILKLAKYQLRHS